MDIRSIIQFLQVAKDGSYTQAAAELYLAQPTLSKTVQNLEQELGVPLFQKKGQRVELTDYGKKLVEIATPIVNDFQKIPFWLKSTEGVNAGPISVAVTPILASAYLVSFISDFCKEYPSIELKLYEHGTYDVKRKVLRGECDLGLCMACPEVSDNRLFDVISLVREEMVVLVHEDDPLCQQDFIQMEQLKDRKFNLYTAGHALMDEIYLRCKRAGFTPTVNFSSGNATFLARLSQRGNGITILPRPFFTFERLGSLKAIAFAPSFPWECCLIVRRGRYHPHIVQLLIDALTQSFPGETADT